MKPQVEDLFLDAKHISFAIHGKRIIHDFSYSFKPGRLYVFFGESGCGKTTLLSLLAGYLKPTKGKILLPIGLRKDDVSFFSESGACLFDMTVYQNIALFSNDNVAIDDVLSAVGLIDKKYQKTNTLSKGELARLALARMVLCDKPVMFFDEPTANLDYQNSKIIFSVLRQLCKTKIVIIASHESSFMIQSDIILKANDKNSFEATGLSNENNTDFGSKITIPDIKSKGKKKHISLTDHYRIIRNIFARRLKHLIILIPIFFILFFVSLSSASFITKSGNEIFYSNLSSCNINGTPIQEFTGYDNLVVDGINSRINETHDCIALAIKNQSFMISHASFTIQKNDAVIPSSYAEEFSLQKGDKIRLSISDEEKEFRISDIYHYNDIKAEGFLSDLTKEKNIEIKKYNQPVLIKDEVLKESGIQPSFQYALTDFFRNKDSLVYNNFILGCLDQNTYDMIIHKTEYNLPFIYFFWIALCLIAVASYFYSASIIVAIQNDLLVFKLTKNDITDPLVACSLCGFLYFLTIGFLSLISYIIFSPLMNKLASQFYLLKATLSLFTISPFTFFSFVLLLIYSRA